MGTARREPESSLELLLDTICNTFGGILFIAILLVILLQMSSPDDLASAENQPVDQESLNEMRRREVEVRHELDTLRGAAEQLAKQAADYADPDLARKLEQLEQRRSDLEGRMSERLERLGRIAEQQSRANEIADELAKLDEELDDVRKEVRDARDKLERERAVRTENAELSRQRQSNKHNVAVVLRYGRLYVWHAYDAQGNRIGPNLDEFAIVEETPERIRLRPLPFAGIPLAESPDLVDRIAHRLNQFSPEKYYVAIAIWQDTFGDFKRCKAALVKLGYQYRLYPAADGNSIVDQGGSDSRVQ